MVDRKSEKSDNGEKTWFIPLPKHMPYGGLIAIRKSLRNVALRTYNVNVRVVIKEGERDGLYLERCSQKTAESLLEILQNRAVEWHYISPQERGVFSLAPVQSIPQPKIDDETLEELAENIKQAYEQTILGMSKTIGEKSGFCSQLEEKVASLESQLAEQQDQSFPMPKTENDIFALLRRFYNHHYATLHSLYTSAMHNTSLDDLLALEQRPEDAGWNALRALQQSLQTSYTDEQLRQFIAEPPQPFERSAYYQTHAATYTEAKNTLEGVQKMLAAAPDDKSRAFVEQSIGDQLKKLQDILDVFTKQQQEHEIHNKISTAYSQALRAQEDLRTRLQPNVVALDQLRGQEIPFVITYGIPSAKQHSRVTVEADLPSNLQRGAFGQSLISFLENSLQRQNAGLGFRREERKDGLCYAMTLRSEEISSVLQKLYTTLHNPGPLYGKLGLRTRVIMLTGSE